jgi:hypothetical protein
MRNNNGPVAQAVLAHQAALEAARARQAQPNKTLGYFVVVALLVYGLWPKISPYIPDEINPAPIESPFGESVDGLHVLITYPAEFAATPEQDKILASTALIG